MKNFKAVNRESGLGDRDSGFIYSLANKEKIQISSRTPNPELRTPNPELRNPIPDHAASQS